MTEKTVEKMKVFTTEIPELNTLAAYLGPKSGQESLKGFLFEAGKKLSITATNLAVGLQLNPYSQIANTGSLIVPSAAANLLNEGEEIALEVNDNEELVINKTGFGGKLKGLSPSEYPQIPKPNLKKKFRIDVEDFENLLRSSFAVNHKATNWSSGLSLEWKSKENKVSVFARAADGNTAIFAKASGAGKEDGKALIPGRSIRVIKDLLKYAEAGEKVQVGLGKDTLLVKIKYGYAWILLMEEVFPSQNIDTLIKINLDKNGKEIPVAEVVVDLGDLEFAIKQAESIMSAASAKKESYNGMLKFSDNEIAIVASSTEIGSGQATSSATSDSDFDALFNSKSIKKGCNLPRLSDGTDAVSGITGQDQVTFILPGDPARPIGVKAQSKKMVAFVVIMPINIEKFE